jgi:hypothetical protein
MRPTLRAKGQLAIYYVAHGRIADALVLQQDVLEAMRTSPRYGPQSTATIDAAEHVARSLATLHEHSEAGTLWEEIANAREAVLGAEATDTLRARNWCASELREVGKQAQAKSILLEVVETCDRLLDLRGMSTRVPKAQGRPTSRRDRKESGRHNLILETEVSALEQLASVLWTLGEYTEGVRVQRRLVMVTNERDPSSPEALAARVELAKMLMWFGEDHEALLLVQSVLETATNPEIAPMPEANELRHQIESHITSRDL